MVKENRKKVGFIHQKLDRKAIDLMLNLRLNGWSYSSLASFFGVDKKAAQYQCLKYGIFFKGLTISIPPVEDSQQKKENEQWRYIEGEKINRGKTYEDYLKDAKKRSHSLPLH